jgi:hypothetical protein
MKRRKIIEVAIISYHFLIVIFYISPYIFRDESDEMSMNKRHLAGVAISACQYCLLPNSQTSINNITLREKQSN